LLVAIFKKSHQLPASLYTILQVLSVTLFKKNPHFKGVFAIPPADHKP